MAAKPKKKAAPRTGTRGKPNRKPQQNKRGGHHGIVRDERGQDQPRDRGATLVSPSFPLPVKTGRRCRAKRGG